jgi:hypothetical protein
MTAGQPAAFTPGGSPWQNFVGVRVIGDVHGEAERFRAFVEEARARDLFVVQIGDLVDRGPDSVGALRLALELREQGTGLFLRANHDDKLRRALRGNPVRIGAELQRTLAALAAASDHETLIPRVREALETAPWWLRIGNHLLLHGAFHPAMLTAPGPEAITPRRVADKCRWLAIYGEGSMGHEDELPARTCNWIDEVPSGITVIIGMTSSRPTVSRSAVARRAAGCFSAIPAPARAAGSRSSTCRDRCEHDPKE